MTTRARLLSLATAAAIWSLIAPPHLAAQQGPPEAPVDQRQVLDDLDNKILDKQRALFAARQRGDDAEVERLKKEFDTVQKERGRIVKDTQHLY